MDLHIGIGEAITLVLSLIVALFEFAKATDEQRLRIKSWAARGLRYSMHAFSALMPIYQLVSFIIQDGPANRHEIALLVMYMVIFSAVLATYIAGAYARTIMKSQLELRLDVEDEVDRLRVTGSKP